MELTFEQKGILWTAMKSNYVQLEKDGVFWHVEGVDVVMGTLSLKPECGVSSEVMKAFTFPVSSLSAQNMTFCSNVQFEVGGTPNGLRHIAHQLKMLDDKLDEIFEHARVIQNNRVSLWLIELFKETLSAIPRVLAGPTDGSNFAIRIWYVKQGWNDNSVMRLFTFFGKCSAWDSILDEHSHGDRVRNIATLCKLDLRQVMIMMQERIEQLSKEGYDDNL